MGRPHRVGTQETTVTAVRFTDAELRELEAFRSWVGRTFGQNPPSRSALLRLAASVLFELRDDDAVQRVISAELDTL
ncbi:hypothetical protein [Polyangium mundeleinium]|uniref:CopG family transcriptional regulator n=1 Tax=Polyangium mundeleinium TaxID=2995306 RepID=A0ABT5EEB2_9BACT|nr:hypothetical protein [Polyangium mundeleinium]MDC0740149.1 hypothetical protein [Polyangium mundeleinium]